MKNNPLIQEVINSGVVPQVIECLSNGNESSLWFEATCALANIALGTSENICVPIEAGEIPKLIHLLSSPRDDAMEQAMWVLGGHFQ